MSTIQEQYATGIPSSAVTKALANKHYALRMDPAVAGDLTNPAIPVTLTGSADNALEVIGEYENWNSATAVRCKTSGMLILRGIKAYDKALNGQGVRATATAGVVEEAGLGLGFGRIRGGKDVTIDGATVHLWSVFVG